jgi:DNA-binding Lrp family transcriptional regulator
LFINYVAYYTLEVDCLLSACVLIRTTHGRFEDVVEFLGKLEGVKRIFPTLGRYDVVVDLKASNLKALDAAVLKMGKFAGVVFTETLVEIEGRGEN